MANVLITGANRGIGLEFVRQYAADGDTVFATCRNPDAAEALRAVPGDVRIYALDVTDRAAIAALAASLDGEAIDILINNAGILTSGQRTGGIDYDAWEDEFKVNAIAPIALAQAFLPHLQRGSGSRLVFMSSILASIGENTGGAYVMYRSSKAALNAAATSLAVDTAHLGTIVLMFHPGWVRTDMGGPNATVSPEQSVAGIRDQVAAATPADSGRFLTYRGEDLPW